MQLGLKGSTDRAQIDERLQHHPDTYEFFLTPADFTDAGWAHLEAMAAYVGEHVEHIVFHHPMKWEDWRTGLSVRQDKHPALYDFVRSSTYRLIKLAQDTGSTALIHGAYSAKDYDYAGDWQTLAAAQTVCLGRMCELAAIAGPHVVFENGVENIYEYGNPDFEQRLLDLQLPLAYDVSHAFLSLGGDNNKLIASLKRLRPLIRHYHLVDSMGAGVHDSLTLGEGRIDWARVLPVLNPAATSIYEIVLADQSDCREMLASHEYLTALAEKLQRQ